MKILLKTVAVVLPLAFASAHADTRDDVLLQFSGTAITQMNDSELDDVTGTRRWGNRGWHGKRCTYCDNLAQVSQANVSQLSGYIQQGNGSNVQQGNN